MRRLLTAALIAFTLFAGDVLLQRAQWPVARLHASAALVTSGCAGSSDDQSVAVTGLNTTGANFLVVAVSGLGLTTTPSDNAGNTWTNRTLYQGNGGGGTEGIRVTYAENPATVGPAHDFNFTKAGSFPSMCVMAFSGMRTASVYASEAGTTGTGVTTFQAGSVTPSATGIVLAALHWSTSRTVAINSSFASLAQVDYDGLHHYGVGLAFLGTGSAQNPTWSWGGGSTNVAGSNTVFLEPASTVTSHLLLNMGVGK